MPLRRQAIHVPTGDGESDGEAVARVGGDESEVRVPDLAARLDDETRRAAVEERPRGEVAAEERGLAEYRAGETVRLFGGDPTDFIVFGFPQDDFVPLSLVDLS